MTYSPFRHIDSVLWKHTPIHLTFFLTRRCNAKCPFCFYLSSEPEKDTSELTLAEINKISASLGKLLWLAFSGGEIFLRDDIVEITQIFYKKNRPSIILFPTNGLLTKVITEKIETILKNCNKSTIVVKLSLEGSEKLHDSIRGSKGSFKKTMETYNALGNLLEIYPNFELGINTVFCSANQDNMDELIEFVSKLDKIKTHTISMIRGEVSDKKSKDIDIGKYYKTIKKLELKLRNRESIIYRFKGAGLKAAQDIIQRRLIHKTMISNRQLIPCYAGRLNLVLTETGNLYPCESFNINIKIGNVKDNEYDLKKLINTKRAREVIQSIQDTKCYCTHECYMMTNILFNPLMYPSLIKEYLKLCCRKPSNTPGGCEST